MPGKAKAKLHRAKKVAKKPTKRAVNKKSGGAKGTDPRRVAAILQKLDEAYPNATCELNHRDPFQLLIATILSAQCTDVRVNEVTKELFKKYKTPQDFAAANPSELEQ